MKKALKAISAVLNKIYGYGIAISLFLGGITVLGYIAALIIGGDTGAAICSFIYKDFFKVLIIASNCVVFIGLVVMYLSGEKSMSIEKTKKKGKKDGTNKEDGASASN